MFVGEQRSPVAPEPRLIREPRTGSLREGRRWRSGVSSWAPMCSEIGGGLPGRHGQRAERIGEPVWSSPAAARFEGMAYERGLRSSGA